jgi:outer membrane protein assembly factor BamA
MRIIPWGLLLGLFFPAFLHAQCGKDHRSNKSAGILISEFTITGTQTIGATEIARITRDFVGSCFDEDSDEMEQRVRGSFQDRGYFAVKMEKMEFKPRDPLGIPKSVTLQAEISEGPRYKLGEITFADNHAFNSKRLREQFPLKRSDLFERGRVASGLESLRKLYGTRGFLDFTSVPETRFGSNAIANLNISVEEGPQYHMGKLDIVADKEIAARLRAEWKLTEGDVYDRSYVDTFLDKNRDLVPAGFSRADVSEIQNCPDAVVEVRMMVDPGGDESHAEPRNVPCEKHDEVAK